MKSVYVFLTPALLISTFHIFKSLFVHINRVACNINYNSLALEFYKNPQSFIFTRFVLLTFGNGKLIHPLFHFSCSFYYTTYMHVSSFITTQELTHVNRLWVFSSSTQSFSFPHWHTIWWFSRTRVLPICICSFLFLSHLLESRLHRAFFLWIVFLAASNSISPIFFCVSTQCLDVDLSI